jgi:hypothetical protein
MKLVDDSLNHDITAAIGDVIAIFRAEDLPRYVLNEGYWYVPCSAKDCPDTPPWHIDDDAWMETHTALLVGRLVERRKVPADQHLGVLFSALGQIRNRLAIGSRNDLPRNLLIDQVLQ